MTMSAAPSVLPHRDFAAGTHGWTIVPLAATGVRWHTADGALHLRSSAGAHTAIGSVLVHSPRVPASGGHWHASLEVTTDRSARVDLAVVVDAPVPVPGPPPTTPPFAVVDLVAGVPARIDVTRLVPQDVRAVGLRLRLPAGVDAVVSDARLNGPVRGAVSTLALVGPATAPFHGGALVARGRRLTCRLVGDAGAATGSVLDIYRGACSALDLSEPDRVILPTDRCGVFVAQVDVGGSVSRYRYAVDDDVEPLPLDAASPWAVTSGLLDPEGDAHALHLLGMAHTRIYSAMAAFHLPAATRCHDATTAAATAAAVDFVGAAAGSAAALACGVAAGEDDGRDGAGWPRWADAARLVEAGRQEPQALHLNAKVLDPYRGISLLAETSMLPDAGLAALLAEQVSRSVAGRDVVWSAANEPDLGGALSPQEWAQRQRAFTSAVRRGEPGAPVVGPALADGWDGSHQGMTGWRWLEQWLVAGGADAVDAVSLHLHMLDEETATPEREGLERLIARTRRLVDQHGGSHLPLWVTEMGWRGEADDDSGLGPGETGRSVTEQDQCDLLVRAGLLAVAAGVERFYFFHLNGFRPFGEGVRFDWGLVTGVLDAPKAAFLGLRQLARTTAHATGYRLLPTADRIRVVLADRPEGGVAVAWQWSGGPGLFALADAPPNVDVRDLMGEPADGTDLRRPHLITWTGASAPVHNWLSTQLCERYPE